MHRSARMTVGRVARVVVGAAAGATLAVLAGCGSAVLDPAGPVGRDERSILLGSLAIMATIVVPTIVAVFAFAWWFRAGNAKARYLHDWEFSPGIEIVVWFVPLMTIILLGGVTWLGSHALDPAAALEPSDPATKPVEIQVVSLDWKWLFIYPDAGVASLNRVVIPAATPVRFRITSASVFNSFFVPRLGSMIYAMNGMATTLHLQADRPGTFRGMSTHFSGDGFSDMRFDVQALPAADYAAWLAGQRGHGEVLDDARYAALTKPEAKVAPRSFGSVAPDLFDRIVAQRVAPAAHPLSAENLGTGAATAAAAR